MFAKFKSFLSLLYGRLSHEQSSFWVSICKLKVINNEKQAGCGDLDIVCAIVSAAALCPALSF